MRIVTSYDHPPIPDRRFDWSAVDADTFDAEYIDGALHSSHPVGHGRTEAEAVADLQAQIKERAEG